MELLVIAAIVLAWLVCGVIAAGADFADFQGRYPDLATENRRSDLGNALLGGLAFGPIALIVITFTSGFWEHGWRLR